MCKSSLHNKSEIDRLFSVIQVDNIALSGVRALPLAAGRNEGGHYFRYLGPSVLRAPAEQTKVTTVFGN